MLNLFIITYYILKQIVNLYFRQHDKIYTDVRTYFNYKAVRKIVELRAYKQ